MDKLRSMHRKTRRNHLIETLEPRAYLTAVSFASHVDFADGTAPTSIVTGDFNGDKHADLVTADALAKTVNVFFGTGTGTFTTGPVLTLSAPPTSLITGDFNHDGLMDLAVGASPGVGNTSTTITVFLNTGNSTFGTGQITTVSTTATTGQGIALVAGDFNGDGNLDIATADFSADTVSVLLGTGAGTFAAPVTYPVGNSPSAIVSGHFNSTTSLDLAVAGVRAVTGGGPGNNVVTILNGVGDGTFNVGADVPIVQTLTAVLTTADFNNDGLTDLVVGSLNDSVEVLENIGSDSFTAQPLVSTSGPVASVVVADFNFDGIPDIAAAQGGTVADPGNDNIAVATGLGGATFVAPITLPTGSAPSGTVVADFNGDHKLDIASANFEGGTVSVELNTTPGSPQLNTTTTVATSAAMAAFGTSVALTATIVGPVDVSSFATGSVNFYQGVTLLGTAVITAGTDTATLTSTTLPVGTDSILARYQGDGLFAPSSSALITETITPTPGHGPDLIGTFVSSSIGSAFAPGEKGTIKFRVTNQGNSIAKGSIIDTLYLSLDSTLDAGDIPVNITGQLAAAKVNIGVGKSTILTGNFTIPADTSLGTYVFLADINPTATLLESDSTNNTAASPTAFSAVDEFGTVGGKSGVTLSLADNDGTQVTYKLTGPGTGTVNVSDSGIDLVLTATTNASNLVITGKGGNGTVDLSDIGAVDAIGSITAATTNLTTMNLNGSVGRLKLNNFSVGGGLLIGPGTSPNIQLNETQNLTLSSVPGIKSFVANGIGTDVISGSDFAVSPLAILVPFGQGSISAPWIGSIKCKEGVNVTLALSGVGSPRGVALGAVTAGDTTNSEWSISGDVGKIVITSRSGSNDGVFNITGQLKSLVDAGSFDGQLNAAEIGSVAVGGDFTGHILAGANFGDTLALGGGDDTFAAGAITSVHITGNVTAGAILAAGLDPVDDILLNGNDTLFTTGSIKNITINGTADPASKFLASSLPKRVRIGRTIVSPTTDTRFQF